MIDKISEFCSNCSPHRDLYSLYFIPWVKLNEYYTIGEPLYESDWDLAIILDACRVDALREVASEYPFIDSVQSKVSVGSSSKEWMVNSFGTEYIKEINKTTYITSNAWVDETLTSSVDFSYWTVLRGTYARGSNPVHRFLKRDLATKEDFSHISVHDSQEMYGLNAFPASDLTDYAIRYGRVKQPERMIIHYMQPHEPYIHNAVRGIEPTEIDKNPFENLRNGVEKEAVWDRYLDNLRYVLDSVSILLENYDAKSAVITADHGELFGEWSIYGHGEGIPHPALKRVPWVETQANDLGKHDPANVSTETDSTSVDDRLEALGYL